MDICAPRPRVAQIAHSTTWCQGSIGGAGGLTGGRIVHLLSSERPVMGNPSVGDRVHGWVPSTSPKRVSRTEGLWRPEPPPGEEPTRLPAQRSFSSSPARVV